MATKRKREPARVHDADSELLQALSEDESSGITTQKRNPDKLIADFETTEFAIAQERNDFLLHQVLDFVDHRQWINLTPSYQRRKRWDNRKKSLLIESLLMNLPVPPIFLFEVEPARYEVMDGQQRLSTIHEFYAGKLPLSHFEQWPELNNLRYSEWPSRLQRGLDRRKIAAVVLRAARGEAAGGLANFSIEEIRRTVFNRLNTGGEKLNPQELRNSLYAGSLNNLILELSRENLFTEMLDIPPFRGAVAKEPRASNTLYRTMGDCQLVLRFLAFRDEDRIRGSVRSTLDRFMSEHREAPNSLLHEWRKRFVEALSLARDIFGKEAFHLPTSRGGRVSVPLFDAVMVAADKASSSASQLRKARIKTARALASALEKQSSYEVITGKPNTAAAIRQRIDIVHKILMSPPAK